MYKAGITALAAMAFAAIAPITAHAKVISHFKGDGAFASASDYAPDGKSVNLYVSQGGSAQSTQTYLEYYSTSCDSSSWVCTGITGSGLIPNNAFSVSPQKGNLSVNLSGLPGFSAVRWTFNRNTWEYTESPVGLGAISVAWKSSGVSSQKSTGTSTTTYLNTTWKTVGQYSSTDAFANGTVNGEQWTNVYGNIGTNSSNERYMERN
jgi:hypothetical protein